MSGVVVEIKGVSKSFPGVRALDDVSISLAAGEIHALVGENGAGKSTLIKIITGVHLPDSGSMRLDGKPVSFRSPREAINAGIGAVHQERNLVPLFSIAENICLDRLPTSNGFIDNARITADAEQWMKTIGLALTDTLPNESDEGWDVLICNGAQAQPGIRLINARGNREDLGFQRLRNRPEQAFLAGKVVVDGAGGDPGVGGDTADLGARIALAPEVLSRRRQQSRARGLDICFTTRSHGLDRSSTLRHNLFM